MLGAILPGQSLVRGLLHSEDVAATRRCLEATGARYEDVSDGLLASGGALVSPEGVLDCANSGTTMRLLTGLFAGAGLEATLTGDASLRRRPMGRILRPLGELGLVVESLDGRAPLQLLPQHSAVRGGSLRLELASAQVKSCLLLGALTAGVGLSLRAPRSRDHTERLLAAVGTGLEIRSLADGTEQIVLPADALASARAVDVEVPGDISSAAFLLVAASIVPGSDLLLEDVGLNPSRTGVLDVLGRMGADVKRLSLREVGGELRGDLRVRYAPLVGTRVGGDEIPRLIDELPVLALAAACARGETLITDAAELRVKESDRVASTVALLTALGAEATALPDGLRVQGKPGGLRGCVAPRSEDHRLAMTGAVAGLLAEGGVVLPDPSCMAVSFPGFAELVVSLQGRG